MSIGRWIAAAFDLAPTFDYRHRSSSRHFLLAWIRKPANNTRGCEGTSFCTSLLYYKSHTVKAKATIVYILWWDTIWAHLQKLAQQCIDIVFTHIVFCIAMITAQNYVFVQSANILLDDRLVAKVSDFGWVSGGGSRRMGKLFISMIRRMNPLRGYGKGDFKWWYFLKIWSTRKYGYKYMLVLVISRGDVVHTYFATLFS